MSSRTLKASEAEKFIESWLVSLGYVVHRARRSGSQRDGKWFTASHDLFGCLDLLAVMSAEGNTDEWPALWGLQVTTAKGMTARRRKVESLNWPLPYIDIGMARVEAQPDPAHRGRSIRYVCIQPLISNRPHWGEWIAHAAPGELWRKVRPGFAEIRQGERPGE